MLKKRAQSDIKTRSRCSVHRRIQERATRRFRTLRQDLEMARAAGSGFIRPILFVMMFFSVLVFGIEVLLSYIDDLLNLAQVWPQWIMYILMFATWIAIIVYAATRPIYIVAIILATIALIVELALFIWWLISGFQCLVGTTSFCPAAPFGYTSLLIQSVFSLLLAAVAGYGLYGASITYKIWIEQNERLKLQQTNKER